ncbi:MAG TPA: VWA domain-containing protein [Vicinamibacterales bacterium]|nr:VWA domain-containing protein [Vicinamibacterales bacterium]
MRLPRVSVAAVLFAGTISAIFPQQQAPTGFRAGVDAVMIDVSVFTGNAPVSGLTAADFALTDNGVAQTITSAAVEQLPIDLTLVLDASGSMKSATDRVRLETLRIASGLGADDGFRLMKFATLVASSRLQRVGGMTGLDFPSPGGSTSFYQALLSSLIVARRVGTADRRQLIVAMSDGQDSSSFLNPQDVLRAAQSSDAVLHVFLVRSPSGGTPAAGWHPYWDAETVPLDAIAAQTGGWCYREQTAEIDVARRMADVVTGFRTSYVLRYTASGVPQAGWHDVAIQVNKPGKFVVRAKKGYFGAGGR